MPDGSFPVEIVKGMPVVAAPEEIDITNAGALRATLLNAAANGHGALVVDMTRTQFCDSSGLHTLIAAHKRAEAEGREVLLVIPSPTVLRVIKKSIDDAYAPVREAQDRFNVLAQVNPGFWESGEQTEGAQAFLQKRRPDFSPWA